MDSFFDKLNSPMHKIFDAIYNLVVLNLCMIIGIVIGLGLFGLFPSIVSASFILKRQLFDKEKDINIFKEFKTLYLEYFKRANFIFIVLIVLDVIVVMDSLYVYQTYIISDQVSWFGVIFSMITVLMVIVVLALNIYLPMAMVFFEKFNIKDALRFGLLSTIGTPLLTIQYFVIVIASYIVFSVFISATPFVGLSLPLYFIIRQTSKRYYKFFVVANEFNYDIVYYKTITNKERYLDILRSYLDHKLEDITLDTYQAWCKKQKIQFEYSFSILDKVQHTLGFILSRRKKNTMYIKLIVIHNQTTRNGLGTTLLQNVIPHLKKQGITQIVLDLACKELHPLLTDQGIVTNWAKKNEFKQGSNQYTLDI